MRKLRDIGKKGQRDEIVSIGAMVIEKENEMSKNKSQGLIWDRLKTYYNEKGISAREFKCDCYRRLSEKVAMTKRNSLKPENLILVKIMRMHQFHGFCLCPWTPVTLVMLRKMTGKKERWSF